MTYSWAGVVRPKQGQTVSGDVYTVIEQTDGSLLVGVIDGLGGGTEAARAAQAAQVVLAAHPEWPLQELIQHSHRALHSTRGAVIGLLRLNPATARASYTGVGNIGIHVYSRQSIKPISKNGILGFRLPVLLELHYTYDPGDIFVMYSDGISSRFSQDAALDIRLPPQEFSQRILQQYGKQIDDATVVTIRT